MDNVQTAEEPGGSLSNSFRCNNFAFKSKAEQIAKHCFCKKVKLFGSFEPLDNISFTNVQGKLLRLHQHHTKSKTMVKFAMHLCKTNFKMLSF